jgi:hypothetical protein
VEVEMEVEMKMRRRAEEGKERDDGADKISSGYLHDDGLLGYGVSGADWGVCYGECGV